MTLAPPAPTARFDRPLVEMPVAAQVRLDTSACAPSCRLRMAELGLRAGSVVTVVGRSSGGGRVVQVGTARVAVDRLTACALRACPVASDLFR